MQDKLPLPQAQDALTLLERLSARAKPVRQPPALPTLPPPEQHKPSRAKGEPLARPLGISAPPLALAPSVEAAPFKPSPATGPAAPADVRTRFAQVNWARERHKAPVIQLPVTTSARFAQVNWTRQAQPHRSPTPPVTTSLRPDPKQTESSTVQSVDSFFSDIQW